MEENDQIYFTLINKCVPLVCMGGCGKSEMLRYLVMAEKHKFYKIFCLLPIYKINNSFNDFIQEKNIFEEWDDEYINELLKVLSVINKGKKCENDKPKNVLLILDDCCSDTKFHNSKKFEKLFTTGRYFFLSVIISSQYITNISPSARNNSEFILVSALNNYNIQILADEYILGNLNRKTFILLI